MRTRPPGRLRRKTLAAAYNAETILARSLDGHYARADDEAYSLIREALSGGRIRYRDRRS
jgi:hypothetical protein